MTLYNAFVSYSHAADGKLAPALQQGLQRFAKSWYQLRALRLFRDQTTLSMTPGLWSAIEKALNGSENFILMASPLAASSIWVQREVRHWLEHHGPGTLYIVLTEGTIVWDDGSGDFDWSQTDALPPELRGAYDEEPFFLDLRWARSAEDLSLDNPRFRNALADLAAPLHRRPKDELVGEDVRQHRRTRRAIWAAVLSLSLLTVAAAGAAVIARAQRNSALALALGASAQAELQVDPERSLLLAAAAVARKPVKEAQAALRQALHASAVRASFSSVSWPDVGGFSPDGRLGLIVKGRVQVVEIATGRVLTELEAERSSLSNATFSPDGRRVAATTDRQVHLWEVDGWRHLLALSGHQSLITDLSFSGDGTRIATASTESVRIWRADNGEPLAVIPRERSEGRGGVVLGPAGRWAAIAVGRVNSEGAARIYEVADGSQVAELGGHGSVIGAIAFTPDGRLVTTSSWDGTTRLWNTGSWDLRAELRGHKGAVTDAAISPDGRWLVTTSMDRTARVWELESEALAYELRGHADQLERVAFSADGGVTVLTCRDGSASVWETRDWRRITTLRGHTGPILNVAISAAGDLVMTASQDQTARIWAVRLDESPVRLPGFSGPGLGAATAGLFSPDGSLVVTSARSVKDRARIWTVRTGALLTELDDLEFHGFDPAGRLAVTGGGRGEPCHLWETDGWRLRAELAGLDHEVEDVAFSPDGRWLATADGYADVARVWEVDSGRLAATLEGHAWRVLRVTFAPNGDFLVTASYDKTARVWATGDWSAIAELRGHAAELFDLAISPDGRWLATASYDATARIWDTTTWEPVAVLSGHRGEVVDVAFSADGARLATASQDDTATLWSTESWKRIAVLQGPGHKVRGVAFSPRGGVIATTGGQTVRLWDAVSGAEIVTLSVVESGRGHHGGQLELEDGQFSPDGGWLAVSSNDGNVRLYAHELFAPIDELVALVEARATRELTAEERSRFLR